MNSSIKSLPKSTVELTITLPWTEIDKEYESVFGKTAESLELPGFRKGKAPKNLVEEKINKAKVYEEVLQNLLPKHYAKALKEHHLNPIVNPKIEITEMEQGKDWAIKATVAQKPPVNLGNYKDAVRNLNARSKIWVPGEEEKKESDGSAQNKNTGQKISEIFIELLKTSKVEIPDLLVEEQANRELARLIDQTQKLGLTIEQYLKAQNKTAEELRAQYFKEAGETLSLEFILEAISEEAKIVVTTEEINKLIENEKDETAKKNLQAQSYYLAMILRKQKTVDYLLNL